jgi:hypothetical protein
MGDGFRSTYLLVEFEVPMRSAFQIPQAQNQPPKVSTNLFSRLLNDEFLLLILLESFSAFYHLEST